MPRSFYCSPDLDDLDLRCLKTLGAFFGDVLHTLTFSKRLEAAGLDLGEVCEQVLGAIFRRDEAEAFGVVEPLDGTLVPFSRSLMVRRIRRRKIPAASERSET